MLVRARALVDVLRAAASEIEHYDQVAFDVQAGVMVSQDAAVDTVHLLAELLENATAFSPETSQVVVSGFLDADGGALVGIADAGPGLSEDQLRWLNWQLRTRPMRMCGSPSSSACSRSRTWRSGTASPWSSPGARRRDHGPGAPAGRHGRDRRPALERRQQARGRLRTD